MKKTVTLLGVFIALIFNVQAQSFLLESFESRSIPEGWITVDNDHDGFNWDATTYVGPHSGTNCIVSASYDLVVGALTPDNWLITPAVELTADAELSFYASGDQYDYPFELFSVYISTTGTDLSDFTLLMTDSTTYGFRRYSVDLSAYTGQTVYIAFRHHNLTDQYHLKLDDVWIYAEPTSPTIDVASRTLDFGEIAYPGTGLKQFPVATYFLTGNISATVTSPFQVSSDNQHFSSSATLPSAGGMLYLKFDPTTVDTFNGTLTLSSDGASDVVVRLKGMTKDCDNLPLPYFCGFNDVEMIKCWNVIDANFDRAPYDYGAILIDPTAGLAAYGFSSQNAADDWLISPSFTLGAGAVAEFYYSATADGTGYIAPEKYEVYVIPEGHTFANATLVVDPQVATSEDWLKQRVKLVPFNGQKVQIAIHIISDADAFILGIKDFSVENGVLGVEEIERTVNVYPNPACNVVNVNTMSEINNIEIFTMSGQRVGTYDGDGTEASLNISNLSNGLYMMRINTTKGVVNQKFNVLR